MRPEIHARLYGPWRASAPKPERSALTLTAWALWLPTLVAVAGLTLLAAVVAIWGLADGMTSADVASFVVPYLAFLSLGTAFLALLAFASPLRRLTLPARMVALGALALPVPVGVALWLAAQFG
ncbi:hypothetical protein ABZX85_46540 [Streptomyces sp. NPDC004539]|uniref:hypothetical protein n=1 Tax=Streptomyces sp. NPDC004539 TaxID=3154280 RepID=UPI0033AE6A2D